MSTPLYPARPLPVPSAWMEWLNRIAAVLIILGLGVVLGSQYMEPNKRILSVAAAVIVIGMAWRIDMVSGIGVMILALPYPRGTTFGSTNIALILLLLVIYLLRLSQREVAGPRRTPADAPIAAFFLAVVVSFYNVASVRNLYFALQNFELFVGTLLMFFLIVSNVRDTRDLQRLHAFQTVAALSVFLVALWELNHPGGRLIPGWIEFTDTHGNEFNLKDVRVGATFYDFELLADFCGLNLLLMTFLVMRAKNAYRKAFYGVVLAMSLFVMFSTVTRGPIVALGIALLYMAWIMRRHLKVVPMTILSSLILAAFFAMNFYVANFTRSGNLFARMENSKFVGWMPDSRAGAWTDAWTRMWEHPLIGHGPYYSAERGLKFWYWPHNLYLYVGNAVGLIGLAIFLWLMWTFWKLTKPTVDTPAHPDYAKAYLLIAHVQLVFFLVDQFKIEYWRNPTYQFQVWLMFALWVSAWRVANPPRPTLVTS